MSGERTPLLHYSAWGTGSGSVNTGDLHTQFCQLVGTRPVNLAQDQKHTPHPASLYQRAVKQRSKQSLTYMLTATITNSLLLTQIVLGATLTGLAASNTNYIAVTVFGALNTIIAGIIAFLKSRGQPMRARMFRDDLERVVDEIENSAIMWLGISKGTHGYDAIDTDEQVTVRSEVARLTRLYDKAVKTNTLNDPDMYASGGPGDPHSAALKGVSVQPAPVPAAPPPAPVAAPSAPAAPAAAPAVPQDPDASPASKAPEPPKPKDLEPPKSKDSETPANDKPGLPGDQPAPTAAEPSKDKGKQSTDSNSQGTSAEGTSQPQESKPGDSADKSTANPQPTPVSAPAPVDPDESPASAAHLQKHTEDTSKGDEVRK